MLSLRNFLVFCCLGIASFCALQTLTFDSYRRLRNTITTFIDGNVHTNVSNHNNTLGIASKIYVLSLPARTDRRRDMDHLRKALDLRWTYMEALDSQNALVARIMDSVRHIRQVYAGDSVFTWPDTFIAFDERVEPWDPAFFLPLPASSKPLRPQPLVCATENTTFIPYQSGMPEHQLLTNSRIACWYSHMSVIESIANDFTLRAEDAVIVLEDDVDMERDIEQRLQNVWSFLPPDWDIVYLGHCWSDEGVNQPLSKKTAVSNGTRIHPSIRPLCTHAYVLSRFGARRLLLHLRHPLFAYSRSIDKAIAWLIENDRLKSFSIVPSVIVQRKAGVSDIMPGKGSGWKAHLFDGFFEPT